MATQINPQSAGWRPVLFLQGGGAGTHDEWDHKLVASLTQGLGKGFAVHYPRLPDEAEPSFASWSVAIEHAVAELGDDAILVGHSIGGTVLIHTLARRPELLPQVAAVCLIAAPFVGEGGWPGDEISSTSGWAAALAETPVFIYQGDADDTTPMAHADLYASAIPHARLRRLDGRDHQLDDDLTEVAQDILQHAGKAQP